MSLVSQTSLTRRLVEGFAGLPRFIKLVLMPVVILGVAVWVILFHNRAEFWED